MALLQSLLLSVAALATLTLGDGWLGIRLDESETAPTIGEVFPGSPAAKNDLRKGDVVLSVNGKRTADIDALYRAFEPLNAGDTVQLGLQRGKEKLEKRIRLTRRPDEAAERREAPVAAPKVAAGKPYMGVEIEETAAGIVVARVVEGGPAAGANLRSGDVLRAVNEKQIKNFDELDKVMSTLRAGQPVALDVRRGDRSRSVRFKLGSHPGARPAAESVAAAKPATKKPAKAKPTKEKPTKAAAREKVARSKPAESKPKATAKRTDKGSSGNPGFSTDYEGGMRAAREAGKPVILVFGANWCVNCATLKKALQDPSLRAGLEAHARIWVDTDKQSQLADRWEVESLPHIVFLDRSGKKRKTMIGYQPPADLRKELAVGMGGATAPSGPKRTDGEAAAAEKEAAHKKAAEAKRVATEKKAAEAKRVAMEKAAEAKRVAAERQRAESRRIAAEKRRASEANRAAAAEKAAAERAALGAAEAKREAAKKTAAAEKAAGQRTPPNRRTDRAPRRNRGNRDADRAAGNRNAGNRANQELTRLRGELEQLRREQREQRELLQQILRELKSRK